MSAPEFERSLIIRSINFLPTGDVAIEYTHPLQDYKVNGLAVNHQLFVPGDQDYDDEIEAVLDAATALVRDALEDFGRLDPMAMPTPPDDEEDEDEDD